MAVSHLFRSSTQQPQKKRTKGFRVDIRKENFPATSDLALSLLTLLPKGVREPHWHPNANELSYCLEGRGLMTIFSPGGGHDTLVIEEGTLSMVPKGYLHHIENLGDGPLRLLIAFDSDQPEDLEISSAFAASSNEVLASTFSSKMSEMDQLKVSNPPVFVFESSQSSPFPLSALANRFNFNIETLNPQAETGGGWVKMSNGFLFPTLEGLSFYSVKLEKGGAREPHWHPNAHELNYLISGSARIMLLSPDGMKEVFDVGPGDIGFMPRGYIHTLENIGEEPACFGVFFNHIYPSDIGLSGSFGAYPNQLFADLLNLPIERLDDFPKDQFDRLVVPL